ncbi:MAG: DUF4358 domain-containing protein [Oscillospiraceae bacterium]|nr:DUF4358 domain-containing protein [Oscillospiraceae bacterium]MBR3860989.1 DUF4358 domain-containing protein [Oscillospiraceae bacterium]
MKHSMTSIIALTLCAVLSLGLLAACGGAAVRSDVAAQDLAAAMQKAVGMEDLLVSLDGTFLGLTGTDAEQVGEHEILVSGGATIDEIGVFKAGSMSVAELKALVEDYLSQYAEKRWPMIELYNPTEQPKLTDAEITVLGDYVMYSILSDADRATAKAAFEAALK